MAIEKEKTLDDFKESPDRVEEIFRQRERDHDNDDFEKARPVLFSWALVLSVVLVVLAYFSSGFSKVKTVSVVGNDYLPSSYVEQRADITYNSRFFLIFPGSVSKKLKADPLIEDAQVNLLKDHAVQIEIREKQPIGYRYQADSPTILLSDGTETPLTSELMPLIVKVPYINGFFDEKQTGLLATAFQSVDRKMIEQIAQVDQYSMDYDDQALEVRMRDGVVLFVSYYTIDILNNYNKIASILEDPNNCIFYEQGMKNAVAKACPWNEQEIVYDYWRDEDGNIITNRYGDGAIKHYYRDNNGGYYLDESGNWILIPIDKQGNDNRDPEFLDHYMAGYYASGTLVIPPPEDSEDNPDSTTGQDGVTQGNETGENDG